MLLKCKHWQFNETKQTKSYSKSWHHLYRNNRFSLFGNWLKKIINKAVHTVGSHFYLMVWTKIYKKHLRNISGSNWRSFKKYWAQTSQLSCFIVSHTVSLPSLQSHGRFFISHGFTNFKWIFSQTRNFLRKQTRQHNPLSKKHCSIVIYMQKKLIIL